MADDKRINIRFDPEVWDRLDDKRHRERTTFQDVGARLFTDWLDRPKPDNLALFSEKNASPPLHNSDTELTSLLTEIDKEGGLANQLAAVLRSGNEKAIAIITGAIEVAAFRVERDDLKSGH